MKLPRVWILRPVKNQTFHACGRFIFFFCLSTGHRNVASDDNSATTSNEETLLSQLVDYHTSIIQLFPLKRKFTFVQTMVIYLRGQGDQCYPNPLFDIVYHRHAPNRHHFTNSLRIVSPVATRT